MGNYSYRRCHPGLDPGSFSVADFLEKYAGFPDQVRDKLARHDMQGSQVSPLRASR